MTGFVCFGLSNVLWVIWGMYAEAYALIVLHDFPLPYEPARIQKNLDSQ
jgi:hypothetical protein